MKITKKLCKTVLDIVDAGLCNGAGTTPTKGQVCVEQAVTMALDEEFSDNPSCVDNVFRAFKIRLNDSNWSSNQARAKGMRRLAICQLGTKDTLDKYTFRKELSDLAIGKWLPKCMRLVAEKFDGETKEKIINAANECEKEKTSIAAGNARKVLNDAAYAAYAAAAYATAYATNAAAAYATAYATNAAAYATNAAADQRDQFLSDAAEDVVQVCIRMNTPGSKFLGLTEE